MPAGGLKYPRVLRMKISESSVVEDVRNMVKPELKLYLLERGITVTDYQLSQLRGGQNP